MPQRHRRDDTSGLKSDGSDRFAFPAVRCNIQVCISIFDVLSLGSLSHGTLDLITVVRRWHSPGRASHLVGAANRRLRANMRASHEV